MTDLMTGVMANGAILAALYDRAAHPEGVGQRVDCEYLFWFIVPLLPPFVSSQVFLVPFNLDLK